MEKDSESIIGTFLHAANPKSYELNHLIFTSRRLIAANAGWEKQNVVADSMNIAFKFLTLPLPGPSFNTLLMQSWKEVKSANVGKSNVSYNDLGSQAVLKLGYLGMMIHEIWVRPYGMIKKIMLYEDPFTADYKLKFEAGPFSSMTFLVPQNSQDELKELISKTPVRGRLPIIL